MKNSIKQAILIALSFFLSFNLIAQFVGIGTTAPTSELHVEGVGLFNAPGSSTGLIAISSPGGNPGIIFRSNDPNLFRADIARTSAGLSFGMHASSGAPPARMTIDNGGRVGIGIVAPTNLLHVMDRIRIGGTGPGVWYESGTVDWFMGKHSNGNTYFTLYYGADRMVMTTAGNMGIGTNNPLGKLDVAASFFTGAGSIAVRPQNSVSEGGEISLQGAGSNQAWQMDNYDGNWRLHSNGAERVRFHKTGKVSIGTNTVTGNHKLYVNGGILATRVKVAVLGSAQWADYVFDESYDLKSLEEVDNYIKENKHLPNIPSTSEMMDQGNDLGQTDALLLSKIEELYLHVIELNNRVKELETENEQLKMDTND